MITNWSIVELGAILVADAMKLLVTIPWDKQMWKLEVFLMRANVICESIDGWYQTNVDSLC